MFSISLICSSKSLLRRSYALISHICCANHCQMVFCNLSQQIAPAEGLVSILKKRDDRDGKTIAQVQQRQTKRRVRFQEMEDTFDQGIPILLTHSMCSQRASGVELWFSRAQRMFTVHCTLLFSKLE